MTRPKWCHNKKHLLISTRKTLDRCGAAEAARRQKAEWLEERPKSRDQTIKQLTGHINQLAQMVLDQAPRKST